MDLLLRMYALICQKRFCAKLQSSSNFFRHNVSRVFMGTLILVGVGVSNLDTVMLRLNARGVY